LWVVTNHPLYRRPGYLVVVQDSKHYRGLAEYAQKILAADPSNLISGEASF